MIANWFLEPTEAEIASDIMPWLFAQQILIQLFKQKLNSLI